MRLAREPHARELVAGRCRRKLDAEHAGGATCRGIFDLPPTDPALDDEWVSSNGEPGHSYYGYGCACIDGDFDPATGKVLRVDVLRALPLAQCRADPALPDEVENG